MKNHRLRFTKAIILILLPLFAVSQQKQDVSQDAIAHLFDSETPKNNRSSLLAQVFKWRKSDNPNNICHGVFIAPEPDKIEPEGQTAFNFDDLIYQPNGMSKATGNVQINRQDQQITAKTATFDQQDTNNPIITLKGNVVLTTPDRQIIAQKGRYNPNTEAGQLSNVFYLLGLPKTMQQQLHDAQNPTESGIQLATGYAHGHADRMVQHDRNHLTLYNASYQTSSPYSNAWRIKANQLDIDRTVQQGTAKHSWLYLKGIPVFYWPYITFPYGDHRKTGFLFPEAGNQGHIGYYVKWPFYWNIAPNYDATITPVLYNHAGPAFEGDFRYLLPYQQGSIEGSWVPFDSTTHQSNRYAFEINSHGDYGQHWASNLVFQDVSDKNFLEDFDSDNLENGTKRYVKRQGQLNFNSRYVNADAQVLQYKTIDPKLRLQNRPYEKLPQFNADLGTPLWDGLIKIKSDNQYTYFYKPPVDGKRQVNGQRVIKSFIFNGDISEPWGYFKPTAAIYGSYYHLDSMNNDVQDFPNQNVFLNLPMVNLDTGLTFERFFDAFGTTYDQTLQPRLFYTYIPYKDQSNIPLFDTNQTNFSYRTLFETNRFSGFDRINNANQLSYALETHITNQDTGDNLLDAGIGQMAYFAERKVSLCQGNASKCQDHHPDPFYDANFSNIAGFATWHINQTWNLDINATVNPENQNIDRQSYQLQFKPDNAHIFNASYTDLRNDYNALTQEQIQQGMAPPRRSSVTLSGLWRLTPHWGLTGLWTYSFNFGHTTNMFAGVSYDSCSWAVRLVAQRHIGSSSDPNQPNKFSGSLSNSVALQFQLKGLGNMGGQRVNQKLKTIRGYDSDALF